MKRLFILLLFIPCLSFAQKTILEKAENHFNNYEFEQAIIFYNTIIEQDSNDFNIQIRLAEAYRKNNQSEKAVYWYSQVVEQEKARPVHFLFYAQMLFGIGQCEAANDWTQEYIDLTPDEFHHFRHPVDCSSFRKRNEPKEDASDFFIKKLPVINTKHDEIGVSYYKNTILFTQKSKFIPPIRYDEWYIPDYELINYQLSIDTIDLEQNHFNYIEAPIEWRQYKHNDFNFSTTKNGRQAYFVRSQDWVDADTIVLNFKIFHASWKNGKWQEVIGLPFNSDEYSVSYPYWVEEDSILYFASDMSGGFGGYDLYYSYWEDGIFSPPINLGPIINTKFDEIYPFLNATNQRLYFASNNNESLGGYDIFYSKIYENGYSKSIHLSAPINSEQDDLNFICNEKGTHGYFLSDRMGSEFKMDIYEFLKKDEKD
jgi:hypothetical protein